MNRFMIFAFSALMCACASARDMAIYNGDSIAWRMEVAKRENDNIENDRLSNGWEV